MENQNCADDEVARRADGGRGNSQPHDLALSNLFKLADTAINGGRLDETPRKKNEPSTHSEPINLPATIHSDNVHQAKEEITQIRDLRHEHYEAPEHPLKSRPRRQGAGKVDSIPHEKGKPPGDSESAGEEKSDGKEESDVGKEVSISSEGTNASPEPPLKNGVVKSRRRRHCAEKVQSIPHEKGNRSVDGESSGEEKNVEREGSAVGKEVSNSSEDRNESPGPPLKNGVFKSRRRRHCAEKVQSILHEKGNPSGDGESSCEEKSDDKEGSAVGKEVSNSSEDRNSSCCRNSSNIRNSSSDDESNFPERDGSITQQKKGERPGSKKKVEKVDVCDTKDSSADDTSSLQQEQAGESETSGRKRYPLREPIDRAVTAGITRNDESHELIYETLHNLIRKVRAGVDLYGFFSGKVDPLEAECPDYYDKIDPVNEAMDLDTMEEMIEDGSLRTLEGFEGYLDRIVFCAKKYNTDEENFVRMEADKIHALARPMIDSARLKLDSMLGTEPQNTDTLKTGGLSDARSMPLNTRRKRRRSQERDSDYPETVSSSKFDVSIDDADRVVSSPSAQGSRVELPSAPGRRGNRQAGRETRCEDEDKARRSDSESNRTADEPNTRKRPRREANRNINYRESGSAVKHSNSEDEDGRIAEKLTHVRTPCRRRAQTPGLEGSDIPPCTKDLSASLISSCSSREEWLSYCHEMISVCNEAARRATLRADPDANRYDKPLSEVYLSERLEYQKPLQGFIVRAKADSQCMQGFIVTTDFKTWRKSFRWTMDVAAAGITPTDRRLRATDDGSLTSELQSMERIHEGEKSHQGIIFSRVAEIALLGGLGCGGYLVRRALSEMRSSGDYDYVVLQSTKMAIQFYERLGFVRVGAVTRFRDNNMMPEVAYRHWSEIVDGEAIEASYMMALRLKDPAKPNPRRERTPHAVSESARKAEILSALQSAYSLLLVALAMRATGSASYSNTYREVLATTNAFAVSAQDRHLIDVLNAATKEFTGSQIRGSKAMLREKLDLPKLKDIHRQSSISSIVYESSDTEKLPSVKADTTPAKQQQVKSVAVSIRFDGQSEGGWTDYGQVPLNASIVSSDANSLLLSKSLKRGDWTYGSVNVSVVVGGSTFSPEGSDSEGRHLRSHTSNEDDSPPTLLEAFSFLPSRENLGDVRDSVSTALENLYSFFSGLDLPFKPGDSIMLKVPGYDGSPLWLTVTVQRQCRWHELPKDDDAHRSNSFVVKIVEPHGVQKVARMLDSSNRGVGREWATMTDWHSFSVLPPRILDEMLIGSWVHYPAEDGRVREGFVSRRVGGGLDAQPKWRLNLKRTDASEDNEKTYEDLKAGALREAVKVSEENMHQALSLLKTMGPPFRSKYTLGSSVAKGTTHHEQDFSDTSDADEGSETKKCTDTEASDPNEAAASRPEDYAADWAAARFKKCKLAAHGGTEPEPKNRPRQGESQQRKRGRPRKL